MTNTGWKPRLTQSRRHLLIKTSESSGRRTIAPESPSDSSDAEEEAHVHRSSEPTTIHWYDNIEELSTLYSDLPSPGDNATMSLPWPSVKLEDAVDMYSDDSLDDVVPQHDGASPSMQPVPTAPPRPLSPSTAEQDHPQQQHRRRTEVPAFFQNNGLIMRNDEGDLRLNEATLPVEKSFTIQVGPEQFRLSGASINSDAPSYFSRFFEAELSKRSAQGTPASEPFRTLYVDRDPSTFRDIALHLQGYHVQPRDSTHYVRLFADAQFYVLPRLIKHLFESDVFIRIGEDEFCVPRDLFTLEPGNSPNYFTLGFSLLFSTPGNPFPGLDVSGLLRPPAIKAASASGRSGRVFADILDLLRGYRVHVRDEEHRAALLRDCRYYHLRGLEQKLIPHSLSWNEARKSSELALRLEDLRQSGIAVDPIPETGGSGSSSSSGSDVRLLVVKYARPFVDAADNPHELIVETGPDSATIRPGNGFVVDFHNEARQRVMSLFRVVAAKFAALHAVPTPATLHADDGGGRDDDGSGNNNKRDSTIVPQVFIVNQDGQATARIEPDAVVTVDGHEGRLVHSSLEDTGVEATGAEDGGEDGDGRKMTKRRRLNGGAVEVPTEESVKEWTVLRSQWRLRLESWSRGPGTNDRSLAIHMYAVNLDVVRGQRGRNRNRGFVAS